MLRYIDPRTISDKHIMDHPNLPSFVNDLKKSIKLIGQKMPLLCYRSKDQNLHLISGFYLRRALMQLNMLAFTYIDEQLFFDNEDLFIRIFEYQATSSPASAHLWPSNKLE